jgi:hypothetical protein
MRRTIQFAAIAAALGICGVASAQNSGQRTDATPVGFTFRGGVVFPLDEDLRKTADLFFGLGADYVFPTQLIRGSETFASLDWFARATNGQNGNVFPIALNQRFYSRPGSGLYNREFRNYVFIGAGAAIIDIGGSSTKFMLRGGAGTELGPNIVAEAVLTFSDKADKTGVRANALGVYFGYRF